MNQYRFSLKEHERTRGRASWVLHRRDASKRYLKECSTCNCSYESNVKAGRSGPCCRQEPCLKCLAADVKAGRVTLQPMISYAEFDKQIAAIQQQIADAK